MHSEQRQKTHALLKERQIDQALFARPHSVTWLTGFAPPPQTGAPTVEASYPLVWYDRGQFTLIVVDTYTELAAHFGSESDGRVVTYVGNNLNAPIASGPNLSAAFDATVKLSRNANRHRAGIYQRPD